jgi:hypothetical protein
MNTMPQQFKGEQMGRGTVNLPSELRRDLKIESAHSGKPVYQIIREAFELYKEKHHAEWRVHSKKRRAGEAV